MAAKRSFGWLVWIVVLALVGGGGFYAWKTYRTTGAKPAELKTATLSKGDITQQVTANGSLNPRRYVEVGSQISGTLKDVKADFNSKVTSGELIAEIDPATYERALAQSTAEVANATAGLELAQLNFNRAKELIGANLISKSEYDQAKVSLTQADAVVKMRQANLEKAEVDLSRTKIYAPIDGIVISRKVEIGQTVAASLNAPTLFILADDLAKMQIEAAVSEADVGGVVEGQKVNFTVDAFPSRKFQGTVRQVRFAPTTNQNVVTYTTVVDVDNRDLKLRPGMTANANIITSEKKGVLRISNTALRFRPPAGMKVLEEAKPLTGGTNGAAEKVEKKVEIATSGPFAGLPVPPWMAEGQRRRPTEEERAEYDASLTPEQKEKYQKIMADMRARFAQRGQGGGGEGGGGGGGFGGGGDRPRRSEPEGPRTQTVYLVEKGSTENGGGQPLLKAVTVRLGISDGTNTEIIEGLKEGDVIAAGTASQTTAAAASSTGRSGSPFGGPFGGMPRR